jgi:hypothetical protein
MRRIVLILALTISVTTVALVPATANAQVDNGCDSQPTQTTTLASGRDPTELSTNGGRQWRNAQVVKQISAWDRIPGTRWISSSNQAAPNNSTTLYRTTFKLPRDYCRAGLEILVHADNAATIFLNGKQIGQQPQSAVTQNFKDPAEQFTTVDQSRFRVGKNTLEIRVRNYQERTGVDFKVEVPFKVRPPEPPPD